MTSVIRSMSWSDSDVGRTDLRQLQIGCWLLSVLFFLLVFRED